MPGREQTGNNVGEDVVVEGVVLQDEEHLIALASVVSGREVKGDETNEQMFWTPIAYAWRLAMIVASYSEGGGTSGLVRMAQCWRSRRETFSINQLARASVMVLILA